MTVASIASKMSLIIPVLFSLLILGTRLKEYTILNYTGMLMALVAVVFSSVRKSDASSTQDKRLWYYPVLVFLFGGVIDTSLNYLNLHLVQRNEEGVFPIYIFLVAAISGVLIQVFKRSAISLRSVIGGIILGSVNYFSLYFVLTGLSAFQNDGAFFFPMLNVGIILASSLLSITLFRERLNWLNLTGIMLAVLAIILLSYQEIAAFL
jgi:drug/metabolite transporter (DMT)-like permease